MSGPSSPEAFLLFTACSGDIKDATLSRGHFTSILGAQRLQHGLYHFRIYLDSRYWISLFICSRLSWFFILSRAFWVYPFYLTMRWRLTPCKRPEYGKMRMRCTWWGAAKKVAVAEEEGWMNARLRADARHAACIDEKKTANIHSQQNGDICASSSPSSTCDFFCCDFVRSSKVIPRQVCDDLCPAMSQRRALTLVTLSA